jgi:hypothetical protein
MTRRGDEKEALRMLTSEARWNAVLGARDAEDVLAEAAEAGQSVREWIRVAVVEAMAEGLDDDPEECLRDLLDAMEWRRP